MEEEGNNAVGEATPPTSTETQMNEDVPKIETKLESDPSDNNEKSVIKDESADNKEDSLTNKDISVGVNDESGVVMDGVEVSPSVAVDKDTCTENEPCEVNDDARSLGDLDSLPAVDEVALGAAGSDSGVEGCGRALSSGGGSRSCASSVVSCGSGCGSESSSLAGAPPRPRRRVNVNVVEPKRSSPVGSSTPRPVTAPRGPNLATRERARSREKPTPPEKPRPLTPKPRIRPTTDLPNLVRESPALRAKPTKTSTARCRTPNSPSEEKRWPTNGQRLAATPDTNAARMAADKYGTLPRRRRDEPDGSPKHDSTPPSSRRPTVTRSVSSRSTVKTRVRIYAEKTSQTVLLGTDVESALGGIVPNIETRVEVTKCHRGVQASGRDAETARAASAAAAQERARRLHAETALAEERNARHAEQLSAASELATRQRGEIDTLRDQCNKLHAESCSERERARVAEARLAEAEGEAAEMQDFLAAETNALTHSLRDAEAECAGAWSGDELSPERDSCPDIDKGNALAHSSAEYGEEWWSGAECAGAWSGDELSPERDSCPDIDKGNALAHSSAEYGEEWWSGAECAGAWSGDELSPERDSCPDIDKGNALAHSSAEYGEEWWSGAECAGAWSGDELSPERYSCPDIDKESASASERESLRNLSAAIAHRQRSEAEDERGSLIARVAALDARLSELLAALRLAAAAAAANVTEKNVADVVVKKLAELDASHHMMEQYRQSLQYSFVSAVNCFNMKQVFTPFRPCLAISSQE
ncbi:Cornetto [Operophtera brumata]|uniref:Cornetto n=1 Tax=Operophtera brumata TaxID=104452 RepID=A0A0L7L2L7_OPEBR|nr:Cornetto [Operophtera brumata]